VLLIAGILLIAANLRLPVTGLPPLLNTLQSDLGLDTVAAGALTTLPLLAFALLSPFSVLLAREYGLERALFGALVVIGAGILLRSAGGTGFLYVGTWIIGMGIAAGNVLLPSVVKRDFPGHVPALTGAYALAMGVAAAAGSALMVPLASRFAWRGALALLALLTAVALVAWLPQLRNRTAPSRDAATPPHGGRVWHSALAWQVTLYLGLNSTIYYVAVGWLPSILASGGMTAAQAGSVHGTLQLASAVPGLLISPLMKRLRDQRALAAGAALCSALALAGLAGAPQLAYLWAVLFGVGTGAGIILGLSFIAMRTGHASQAAALSGMAQFVGYLLAAAGPIAMGKLHDLAGGWAAPLLLCAALALIGAAMGALAGRERAIGA